MGSNVIGSSDRFGSGSSGGGSGESGIAERVVRLEEAVRHTATKEDLAQMEARLEKSISRAMEKLSDRHIQHYRWIIRNTRLAPGYRRLSVRENCRLIGFRAPGKVEIMLDDEYFHCLAA